MKKFENGFAKYIAEKFKERLKELGMTQYKFVNSQPDYTNHPTLRRILKGEGGSNIETIAHYADLLGLELIIRKKQDK